MTNPVNEFQPADGNVLQFPIRRSVVAQNLAARMFQAPSPEELEQVMWDLEVLITALQTHKASLNSVRGIDPCGQTANWARRLHTLSFDLKQVL